MLHSLESTEGDMSLFWVSTTIDDFNILLSLAAFDANRDKKFSSKI
jgi:hypothetical protein